MVRSTVMAAVAVIALGLTLPVAPSTFLAMSSEEMVLGAEAVVRGRVVSLESFWDESGRVIVTEAVVRVRRVLVGDAPSRIRVRTPGGRVGNYVVTAEGFPSLERGEEVILFLETADDGTTRIFGHRQGHFRVVERLDGVTLAVPMVEEGRFLSASGQLMPEPQSLRLEEFESRVRELARGRNR